MNPFLKFLLIVLCALLAVKFLPEMFAFGCLLAGLLLALATVGLPLLVAACVAILAFVVLLAPIWLPVLLIVGLVALIRRTSRGSDMRAA
ncbi:MAG: hypothetical protein JNL92_20125 [Opitutaceae bacterium]|nr:hypothetical protein [Opitutaceae bacterium]